MKNLASIAIARRRTEDDDDEPTAIFKTLGGLVHDPALVVDLATPLVEVRRLLVAYRVPAVAVFDASERLRGVVTRTDVLGAKTEGVAADVMSAFVFALPATSSVMKAAALVGYESVGQVLVTDGAGKLLGIVSAIDIVRYFAVTAGALRS
ncbi:MAG: hypothetical protein JWO36_2512 [Myxococcales bacterium]|nr:hypothetical protein [Myxococcales bacterium]